MDAHCEQVLERLWAAEAAEGVDAPEVAEARRHVAECDSCRAWLRRDAALTGRIRDLRIGGATPLTGDARASILRAIREHPEAAVDEAAAVGTGANGFNAAIDGAGPAANAGASDANDGGADVVSLTDRLRNRWRTWPAWVERVAALAAAAILIAGGLTLSRTLDAGLTNEAIVADFHRQALPEITRANLSREEVEAFYRAQFPGDGPQVMIDAPVTKVGVCNLEGRMGAMVEYDWSGSRLVYYQVPRGDKDSSSEKMRMSRDGELNVVRWADARYDYILVSAMPPESLEDLARRSMTPRATT
jgi:hypothetical protein